MEIMKLVTKKGFIRIPDSVISAIAGYAAMNCFGVKGISRNTFRGKVKMQTQLRAKVTVASCKVHIELHIAMEHGINMRAACDSIMEEVRYMVESTTGIKVAKVNVFVDAVIMSK